VQIHPAVLPHRSLASFHVTHDPSEHPAKEKPALPLHGTPGLPTTKLQGVTAIVFLLYAPVFPGKAAPQQQLHDPDPEAPHISITATPHPGEFQHHCMSDLTQEYIPDNPVTVKILPLGRFSW